MVSANFQTQQMTTTVVAKSPPPPPPFKPVRSIQECDAIITTKGQMFEIETVPIRGVPTKVWKYAPTSMRELWESTKKWSDNTYIVYADPSSDQEIRLTYTQMHNLVTPFAHALRDEFGCVKGDRVAIIMRNYPEWIMSFWAIVCLGCIVVPINAWLTGPELEYCIVDSGSKVIIVDGQRAERILPHLPACIKAGTTAVLVARGKKDYPGTQSLGSVMARYSGSNKTSLPEVDIGPDDDATIFYTSGTTGRPKGALGTNRNFVTNLVNLVAGSLRSPLRRGEPMPPPEDPSSPRKSVLLSVPLFHVTGCQSTLQIVTALGHKLVIMYQWKPADALRLIEKEHITNAGGVPSMMWQLLDHPDLATRDVSSLTSFNYGGAPASSELVARIRHRFPAGSIGNGYGLTETSALAVAIAEEDYLMYPDACGFPLPVNDVKIVDDDGREVPRGEIGEVWIKGPNIVKGYWNNPEATSKAFTADGWLKTGDIGVMDKENLLFIRDRAKDMLIRGGENVHCIEVEDALFKHPAVTDAAVVGLAHKVLGEEVAAVVQVASKYRGGRVTERELQAHCRTLIAAFKIPVLIDIRETELPRNANGKITKPSLRKEVAEIAARRTKARL